MSLVIETNDFMVNNDYPITLTGSLDTDEWMDGHDEGVVIQAVAQFLDIPCLNDSESGQVFVYFRDEVEADVVRVKTEALVDKSKKTLLELAEGLNA